jgi:asparagine synthase (glutamine-hydrolysing)
MCGIAGIVELKSGIEPSREVLARMADVLRHRGPDDQGVAVIGAAGLAHRRLAIIDLSPAGHQPMFGAAGAHAIAFNGEIYNFLEIRADLESKGHTFATRSDTEVILRAYEEWGDAFVGRLNGMFALALWDAPRRRLFVARDRLGKKPLYYALTPDRFVFGSEMKAVLASPDVPREVDPASVDEFLSRYFVGGDRTILRHVRKLPPAHTLSLENGRITLNRYWHLRFSPPTPPPREEEALEELESRLRAAVSRRLISDVPLGAFLSGGVDSSAIVAMMALERGAGVKTFTIGFEEAGYSEVEDARVVARHFGTDHEEMTVRADAVRILPDLAWHFDEPFGDASMIPTYYVCQMARRHVTVALAGDGGDELLAGYTRYRRALDGSPLSSLPRWLRHGVIGPLAEALPLGAPGRNWLYAAAKSEPLAPGYDLGMYPYVSRRLYTREFRSRLGHEAIAWGAGAASRSEVWRALPLISRLQWLDSMEYLPDDILVKVDRASMAHSLEVRAPLLDYTLVEYAASLPVSYKYRDGASKYLFRKLLERHLPASVFAKRKQGFAVPKGAWFQGELRSLARERLLDSRALARGYVRRGALEEILAQHDAGHRDYSDWIWCLLVLEEWHRTFLDPDTRRV